MIIIQNADKDITGEDIAYDLGYSLPDKEYKDIMNIIKGIVIGYGYVDRKEEIHGK